MAKVLIRSEVNALVEGTFSTDLSKAVLYEELSGNTDFVVSAVNSVSNLNYTAKQALLDADVRTSASIAVTLTPRQSTIDATGTSVVFDITTAGTASVGTPVYSVVTATYDGGPATSAVINGMQLTLTFPANTDYTPKEITARVKLTIDGNESQSNLATATQSRVEVSPSLSISYTGSNVNSASGNTNAFTITPSYVTVTGYTVSSPGSVKTSGATSVTVNYPANTGSSRTFTVTAKGRDVYGDPASASTTFTQNADSYTFSLSASNVAATATTNTVSITSSGLTNIGYDSSHSSGLTGCTVSGSQANVSFPANTGESANTYTVCLTGKTTSNKTVSATTTFLQSAESYSPSISPSTTAVTLDAYVENAYDGSDVSGSVVFTYLDLSGYTVSKTSGIKTATVTTGSTNTVRFTIEQNETTSAISPKGTITITGKGKGGTDVTMVITVNQAAGVEPVLSFQIGNQSVAADATSASDRLDNNYVTAIALGSKSGNAGEVDIN